MSSLKNESALLLDPKEGKNNLEKYLYNEGNQETLTYGLNANG